MTNGQLLIEKTQGQTRITGILDADPALVDIVGTVKEAKDITVRTAEEMERAFVAATQSGKQVIGGYIKFAKPVIIDHPNLGELTKAAADKPFPRLTEVGGSKVTIDDNGFVDFMRKVAEVAGPQDKGCIEKVAACYFVNNYINSIELGKVDGKEVGLSMPVKVAFKDDATKDWFLGLFNKQTKKASLSGKSPLVENLVKAGVKQLDVAKAKKLSVALTKVAAARAAKAKV